jgi:hypothetical protein
MVLLGRLLRELPEWQAVCLHRQPDVTHAFCASLCGGVSADHA